MLWPLFWSPIRARAQASTPEFFFEAPGQTPTSYTQGLTNLSVGPNATFTLSVWYQYQPTTAGTYYGLDVFVGFDQTNTSGTSATPENDTLSLGTGLTATTAVTNVNTSLIDLSNALAGGADPANATTPSSAVRPYGDDIFLASNTGFGPTGSQPVHLFDITLHNADLGSGGSQNVTIYSSDPEGSATAYTTYLDNGGSDPGDFPRPASSTILDVLQPATSGSTPEPGSLAFICGLVALATPATRRRFGAFTRHI